MLKNTYAKLQGGKDLKVAYIGGSITEGAGSTDKKTKGWRSHATNWLVKTYPESKITEINATIGGTGSELAVFRLYDDVLRYYPDLLFIEFATNDSGVYECEYYEEALIRQVMKKSPQTDIVLVLTCTQRIYEKMIKGEYYDSFVSYRALAEHYGLPLVDIGEAINSRVRAGDGDYMTYTKDSVHPNDLGHTLLADVAIKFLESELVLPAPLRPERFESARIVAAKDIKDTDFEHVDEPFVGENGQRGHGFIKADGAGHYVKFAFTGTTVGIVYKTAHDSGDITWRIDGGDYSTLRLWDEYALRFDRINNRIFANDLALGEHTIELITTGESDERANGTTVEISAFLVA